MWVQYLLVQIGPWWWFVLRSFIGSVYSPKLGAYIKSTLYESISLYWHLFKGQSYFWMKHLNFLFQYHCKEVVCRFKGAMKYIDFKVYQHNCYYFLIFLINLVLQDISIIMNYNFWTIMAKWKKARVGLRFSSKR